MPLAPPARPDTLAATDPCASHPDAPATGRCTRCAQPICDACTERLDDAPYCAACRGELEAKLAAAIARSSVSQAGAVALPAPAPSTTAVPPKAVAFAVGAGVAGALLWFSIVVGTDYKLGLVAVAIGWMVGRAAVAGANGRGGAALAWTSLGIAVASMLLGEYLIVNHLVLKYARAQAAGDLPSTIPLSMFVEIWPKTVGAFDFVFFAIGAYEAWKVPARMRRM
jgi:hypothetical protein